MAVSQSTIRRQAEPHVHIAGERCPWCDQPIPHEKFDEIHARIEAKERERTAAVERRLKEQVAHEKAQVEAKAKAEIGPRRQPSTSFSP